MENNIDDNAVRNKTKLTRKSTRRKRSQRRNTKYNLDYRNIPEENDEKTTTDGVNGSSDRDSTLSVESMLEQIELRGNSFEYSAEHRQSSIVLDATMSVPPDEINKDRYSIEDIDQIIDQIQLRDRNHENYDSKRVSSVVLDAMMAVPPDNLEDFEKISEKNVESLSIDIKTEVQMRRHLKKEAKSYELENFDSNVMYIFNQINVTGYEPRRGTECDVIALKTCFSSLGFKVHVYNDFDKKSIFSTLEYASNSDFSNIGCVSVVVLTHGSRGGYLYAKDRQYHESEVINFFKTHNKPTLVTKPKIFIIQACRGTKASAAMAVGRSDQQIRYDAIKELDFYTLPTESDILLLHSTYAGNVAHREENTGSWFIQTLCKSLTEFADSLDLETIVTEVLKDVAIYRQNEIYNRATGFIDINKQMPVKTSTLIRKLYFKSNLRRSIIDLEAYDSPREFLQGCYVTEEHFEYLRTALRCFFDEHPDETMALYILNIADSMDLNEVSYKVRHSTAKQIQKYLKMNAADWKYYELLYLSGV